MKKRLWKIIFAVLLCGFLPAVSNAQLITIGIEATVDKVTDNDNLLEGKVHIGSTITGRYTYDTSTLDTNPSPSSGEYIHYASPCGIILNLGDFVFSTDFNNVDFVVGITNVSSGFSDVYSMGSRNNLSLYNGVEVGPFYLQFEDYGGTALTSTDLPTTAPVLSDWDYNTLVIGGGTGGIPPCYEKTFYIEAEITSAVLIPEPASLVLLGIGILALKKYK